ncbi:MAG: DUF1569 domain-containing protein [Bacteroidia bacterium]|nr:DUF1569 domain-containing protein [Bacteroidia bacterium]
MKTIYNKTNREELIARMNRLTPEHKAQWGKMTAYQMLKHCCMNEQLLLGKKTYPRLFVGRLFGKLALNNMLKNDAPLSKNSPTHPSMKITGAGDFDAQRREWIELLNQYDPSTTAAFTHPFFGLMTTEQIGRSVYKHTDHHLRQFGN